jgi:hypothetical protein
MRYLLIIAMLVGMVGTGGAVDIYLLQYGYEEGVPCPDVGWGNYSTTQYCSKPPTFEVFGELESAKRRLRESNPVAAFKVWCWTMGNSKPTCQTTEMEIVTAKDLRENAVYVEEFSTVTLDNVLTVKP